MQRLRACDFVALQHVVTLEAGIPGKTPVNIGQVNYKNTCNYR